MRDRDFEYLRGTRLCGNGILLFARDHRIRDTGFPIYHGIRDFPFITGHVIRNTGFCIYHGTTGHGIRDFAFCTNHVQSRGKNPG